MAFSSIPAPITVFHRAWIALGPQDSHGNEEFGLAVAVARRVQCVNEFGRRGSAHEIVSADYVDREDIALEMGVLDVTVYGPLDVVVIGASGVDGDGNPVGGTAYHVDGEPSDNKFFPLPLLNAMVGGAVRLRRIT